MSKNLPAIRDFDARVERILKQHSTIVSAAAQVAAAAAIAGLELKALKKEAGHGAWENLFEMHLHRQGLTLRTAQKYMALADGLKSKALKNDPSSFLPLLEVAPSELTEKDQAKLTKAVAKMTDGATLSELYQDMGIVKKPQGSAAKGGNLRKPEGNGTTDATPADTTAAESKIPKGWEERAYGLNTLLAEALKDNWWNECNEEQRRELHGNLVDAQERVAALLKKGKS